MGIVIVGEKERLASLDIADYLKAVSGRELAGWPVTSENGVVSIAEEFDGKRLGDVTPRAKEIIEYIESINQKTQKIKSETVVTSHPQMIMGKPEHNGFLDRVHWHALKSQLEASGAEIEVLTGSGRNDGFAVWPRDRYVVGDNRTIYPSDATSNAALAKRYYEARTSQDLYRSRDKASGANLRELSGFLEGGDVLQHHKSNTVFVGVNLDPDKGGLVPEHAAAAKALADELGMKLQIVPKTQKSPFYHLDTFMSILPDGSIAVIPQATTSEAMSTIREAAKGNILEITPREGEDVDFYKRAKLTTNTIVVNGNVFSGNPTSEFKEFVESRGFKLMEGNFSYVDSGPHCLTNFQNERGKPDGRSDISANDPVFQDDPLGNMLRMAGYSKPAAPVYGQMSATTAAYVAHIDSDALKKSSGGMDNVG